MKSFIKDNRTIVITEVEYKKYKVIVDSDTKLLLSEAELSVLLSAHGLLTSRRSNHCYEFLLKNDLISPRFTIPIVNWERFEEKFEKLTSKCEKLELPLVSYKVCEQLPEIKNIHGQITQRESFVITVNGLAPKFQGWEFVGTIEFTEGGNVIRSLKEVPEIYRSIASHCDHCKSVRYRKDTYLLKHEDGTYAQVGKNCIKDFLGHRSPEQLAMSESYVKEISAEELYDEGTPRLARNALMSSFVEYCAQLILDKGFFSSKNKAGRTPTGMQAFEHLTNSKSPLYISEKAKKIGLDSIDWNLNRQGDDQFNHNLKLIFKKEIISIRDFGFVAFGVFDYIKTLGELPVFEKKEQSPSEWVGVVGERSEFQKITITKKIEVEASDSRYGRWFYIYVMRDEKGNILTWKTSNATLEALAVYDFKATVKKHDTYKTTKQTELTRLKVVKMYQDDTKENIVGQTSTEELF